jgi:hypothetical protein
MTNDPITVDNRSGQPGGSNAPRTQYQSAGPRPVPEHVRAARRRQVQIDAMTGEQVAFDPAEHELQHQALKLQSHASAINRAIMRSPSHGGRLGGGMVLGRPVDVLPWVFFGAGD